MWYQTEIIEREKDGKIIENIFEKFGYLANS